MRVGVLGGGQLARMLALEGIPLGCRFTVLEPAPDPPAGVAAAVLRAPYDDPEALARLAEWADVVTYEFENVPAGSAEYLRSRLAVLPPPSALEVSQDRLAEKRMFREEGVATAPFRPVDGPEDVKAALAATGLPAVVKTRRFGYDGKGQTMVESVEQARTVVERMGSELIVEGFLDFERELSIICAAGRDGSLAFYPLTENHHRDGILRASYAPAPGLSPELQAEAEAIAERIVARLGYVGVLAIELFEAGGALLANEMAPRVHNSGHWTLDGGAVLGGGASQFENHVRAVAGLPLADPAFSASLGTAAEATGPVAASPGPPAEAWPGGTAAMLNIIGEVPELGALAAVPGARVHLYGKAPRPGRKLGHVTVAGPDLPSALESVRRIWTILPKPSGTDQGPLPVGLEQPDPEPLPARVDVR